MGARRPGTTGAGRLAAVLSLCCADALPRFADTIRGISYGPVPLRSMEGGSELAMDDWMADAAKPMWGPRGRGDLRIMKEMGANMVRLYGNNPENDHTAFLDEANAQGLHVAPGMSDYPYYQMQVGSCRQTDYNCYSQVKSLYARNLENGFMTPGRTYHPALAYMIIINEPDLKMPPTTTVGSADGPRKMCKAIISAFDAMLDAEKEVGVQGAGINFTATFSYAVCTACERFKTRPALGQIAQLDDAMKNPDQYGYKPKNDLAEAYRTRWTHSFNTQNPASDLWPQFFSEYEKAFTTTPVFVAEYHKPDTNQTKDLQTVFQLIQQSSLFFGISYFEYQVAYWKGGTELDFGVFGLGDYVIAQMPYFGKVYNVYCLEPINSPPSGTTKPEVLVKAYGGQGFDARTLCLPSPQAVDMSEGGFKTIASQGSPARMAIFLTRMVQHLGASVADTAGLLALAGSCIGPSGLTYEAAVVAISQKPAWVRFDESAACIADRDATGTQVGEAIGWTCSKAQTFNCDDIPESCKEDPFTTADWVFSKYYKEFATADPLRDCYFGGAAVFASPSLYGLDEVGCAYGKPPLHVTRRTTTSLPADLTTAVVTTSSSSTTSTVSKAAQVDAFVHLEVINVDFAALTETDLSALTSRYAAILAGALGVPVSDVRNSKGETGKVDLRSGSIVVEGRVRGSSGSSLDSIAQRLNAATTSSLVVDATSGQLSGNQAAIKGPLTVSNVLVTAGPPSTASPVPASPSTQKPATPTQESPVPMLPVWSLWALAGVIIALLVCVAFALFWKPRKRRKNRKKSRQHSDAEEAAEAAQLLAPAAVAPSPLLVQPAAGPAQPVRLPPPVTAFSSVASLGTFQGAVPPRQPAPMLVVGGPPAQQPFRPVAAGRT